MGASDSISQPRFADVAADVAAEVDRITSWFKMAERPTGRLSIKGRVDGPIASPRLDVQMTGEDLAWPAIGALTLDGRATVADRLKAGFQNSKIAFEVHETFAIGSLVANYRTDTIVGKNGKQAFRVGGVFYLKDGKKIYLAADTGLFGDMRLIGEESIDLAVLPIGDNYTMGPDDAIRAVKPDHAWLSVLDG